jgi:hypothetical protein
MKATTFTGSIENGRLKLDNRAAFARLVSLLDGKRVELQLRKFKKKRSIPQNNWYFGVLLPAFAEHVGITADDMHEQLKQHFLAVRIDENFARVRSTTELTTEEFSRYMEDCQRLAAEYGVDVAFPSEMQLSGSTV